MCDISSDDSLSQLILEIFLSCKLNHKIVLYLLYNLRFFYNFYNIFYSYLINLVTTSESSFYLFCELE